MKNRKCFRDRVTLRMYGSDSQNEVSRRRYQDVSRSRVDAHDRLGLLGVRIRRDWRNPAGDRL